MWIKIKVCVYSALTAKRLNQFSWNWAYCSILGPEWTWHHWFFIHWFYILVDLCRNPEFSLFFFFFQVNSVSFVILNDHTSECWYFKHPHRWNRWKTFGNIRPSDLSPNTLSTGNGHRTRKVELSLGKVILGETEVGLGEAYQKVEYTYMHHRPIPNMHWELWR